MENQEATAGQVTEARTASTVRDVLIEARKLIEKPEQWAHNPGMSGWKNRHCIITAIDTIVGMSPSTKQLYELEAGACGAIRAVIGEGVRIVAWNDAPGRTHAEVLAAFDKAIAAVGDRESGSTGTAGA